jgi:hypothetical protein
MRSLVALTLAFLFVAGCSGTHSPTVPVISDTGTVRYVDLEGGYWAIFGDGGGHYDVVSGQPDAMKVDGLRVRFLARPSSRGVSIHMWGQRIEIESVDRVE